MCNETKKERKKTNLGRHDETTGRRIYADVARHQTDVLKRLVQVAILLITQRLTTTDRRCESINADKTQCVLRRRARVRTNLDR